MKLIISFVNILFVGEEKFIYRDDYGSIFQYDANLKSSQLIMDNTTFVRIIIPCLVQGWEGASCCPGAL